MRVPAENLLGGAAFENKGFICLMEQLPWERMQIAVTAVASAQAAIDWTVQYVKERKVFGQPVASYQNTRYTLAELQTEVQIAQRVRRQVPGTGAARTSWTPPPPAWPSTGPPTCSAR